MVSIPHRYAEIETPNSLQPQPYLLSIPHRYAKNFFSIRQSLNESKFQFLIGTLKTALSSSGLYFFFFLFQFLIGTLNPHYKAALYRRLIDRFQFLIGTLKNLSCLVD